MTARHRPDDRVEADALQAEVALAAPAERCHDLLEGQHRGDVVGLEAQARYQSRERDMAPLARKIGLGVVLW
jgi:hypothetical protein